MILKIKKLHKDAKLPTHGHPGDAGMDFYALGRVVFLPHKRTQVPTGVALEIPKGHVGLIWDKSGVSFNLGLKILGGVIDAGYRGELVMSLYNTSGKKVIIEKGQKVAQMIIQKFEHCEIKEVQKLSESVRGHGREGSTGHK